MEEYSYFFQPFLKDQELTRKLSLKMNTHLIFQAVMEQELLQASLFHCELQKEAVPRGTTSLYRKGNQWQG